MGTLGPLRIALVPTEDWEEGKFASPGVMYLKHVIQARGTISDFKMSTCETTNGHSVDR